MNKKRLLFMSVGFHEYDAHIIENLKKEFDVWYLNLKYCVQEYPYLNYLSDKLFCGKFRMSEKYISNFIEDTKDCNFDKIFVITGVWLSETHLDCLKKYHSSAKFILYLWDEWSLRKPDLNLLRKYYDSVYSFDSEDCKKYGFKFRPLFFINNNSDVHKLFDVSFVGNEHSGRLRMMQDLKQLCVKNKLKYKFVVTMTKSVYLKQILYSFNQFIKHLDIPKHGHISYENYMNIIEKSKTVVDIHRKTQSGLTMRTIEALAAGAKVITTNSHIREYKNIPSSMYYIWDLEINQKLIDFIKEPSGESTIDQYFSVDSFLKDIMN